MKAWPSSVSNHANANEFNTTVTQNTLRKDAFLDLWRSSFCAINAPGQPPANPNKCNVASLVRQAPRRAADLSSAYRRNETTLSAR